MRLGFYYHIPIAKRNNDLFLPGYLAVFVEALAKEVEEIVLFLHETPNKDIMEADTLLTASNIRWINLGGKTPAWHRSLFHKHVLKPVVENSQLFDLLLVRCPSPLAPYFRKLVLNPSKLSYLVVGDYREGANHWEVHAFRHFLIKHYLKWNDSALRKALNNQLVFTNSTILYESYKNITRQIHLIRTTTLSNSDFWTRPDDDLTFPVKLAYIGRFDRQKGLKELLQAAVNLRKTGVDVELHFSGWDDSPEKNVENELKLLAAESGISSILHWHGKKKVGEELNQMYRDADIYILPSYHEGFPRTIWEAMANSCPVIATRVGSIPSYLEHEHHALLIEPKDVESITYAVKRLVEDKTLRQKIIRNGHELAQPNTLEIQTKRLIQILEHNMP